MGTARSKDGTIRFDRLFSSFSATHKKTGCVLVIAERNEKGRKREWQKNGGQKNGAVNDGGWSSALDAALAVESARISRRINLTTDVTPVSIMRIRQPNVYRLVAAKNGRAPAGALDKQSPSGAHISGRSIAEPQKVRIEQSHSLVFSRCFRLTTKRLVAVW